MAKFCLKKIEGQEDIVKVSNKPLWGKVPDFYRETDWNINNVWFKCNGNDILNSVDPFGDGSCIRRFPFNGDYLDKVSGTVTAVPTGTHNHFQVSGPFGSKCLTVEDAQSGTNYINCGTVSRSNLEGFTISGWVRIQDTESLKSLRYNDSITKDWIQIWIVDSNAPGDVGPDRTPALFYNAIDGRLNSSVGDNILIGEYGESPVKLLGKWVHFTQVIQKFSIKVYINATLVFDYIAPNRTMLDNFMGDGVLYLGDTTRYSTNCSYKNIDLFKRDLSDVEVKALYNQQLFNEVVCNGIGTNPKPFTYLTEREKLLRIVTDTSGNIIKHELIKKPGYVSTTDNLVKYEDGKLIDRYGKNVLSNNLNRILHFDSDTLVNVSANNVWGTFLTVRLDMDTDKYDYVFTLNTTVYNIIASYINVTGGAGFNISISDKPIVTSGHRGSMAFSSAVVGNNHEDVTVKSPLITRDFRGNHVIRCSMCRADQGSTVYSVENHNNAQHTLVQPFGKATSAHLSTLTVYEINKNSNELREGN